MKNGANFVVIGFFGPNTSADRYPKPWSRGNLSQGPKKVQYLFSRIIS